MNLGARIAMWSGGAKMPTAIDYLQSNCVNFWDGIETGGFGIKQFGVGCDWMDLKSGIIKSNQYQSMFEDGVGSTNTYAFSDIPISLTSEDDEFTIEFVWKYVNSSQKSFCRGRNGNYPNFTKTNDSIVMTQTKKGLITATNVSVDGIFYHALVVGGGEVKYYVGELGADIKSGKAIGIDNWSYGNMAYTDYTIGKECRIKRLMSHRVALSESEIAANYAIDKARFGLT